MRRFSFLILFGSAALAAGCGSNDKPATITPQPQVNQPTADTGPKPPGVVAFEAANCNNCHATVGSAKTGNGRGPDLSKVGGKRDKEWIVAHVRDPKAHNPMSRMPKHGEEKIAAKDIDTLGEYLAGLK